MTAEARLAHIAADEPLASYRQEADGAFVPRGPAPMDNAVPPWLLARPASRDQEPREEGDAYA